MRILPRQFHLRLSAVLWLLIALFAAMQILVLLYVFYRTSDDWEQRLQWDLAHHIAQELHPHLGPAPDIVRIKEILFRATLHNPKLQPYIIDRRGHIILSLISPRFIREHGIPVDGIEDFLQIKPSRSFPLYHADPQYPEAGRNRIFSAAKIHFAGKPAYLYIVLNSQRAENFLNGVKDYYLYMTSLWSSIIMTLAVGLIGSLLLYFATTRFRHIGTVVEKISAGELSERVPVRGADEIAQLAAGVNKMADEISRNIEQLKEKDRLRRELIANVSHDLSSPASAIISYLELLREDESALSTAKRREYLETAFASAKSLSGLIRDLFELAKIEAREKVPSIEPFPAIDVVTEEVLPRLFPLAKEHRVELRAEYPETLPLAAGDETLIARVLVNLTENAIRYSGAGSQVTISLQEAPDGIAIEVRDTGQGIAEEDLNRIFEPFYRGRSSAGRALPGTGLGLAIVKRIIEAHGQNLTVASKPGAGTSFRFSLPIYQPPSPAAHSRA